VIRTSLNQGEEGLTLGGTIFSIYREFGRAAILVTLSWKKPETDVDLYVTDPTGATSWFRSKVTPDGGALDVDDIDGWGPEHWTLPYTATVRYGQAYQVHLHYYKDRGEQGTVPYEVTVNVDEGKDCEQTRYYAGSLSVADPENEEPGSSGPDWVTIGSFTPTAP